MTYKNVWREKWVTNRHQVSGEKPAEIFRKLQRVFGNDCLSKAKVSKKNINKNVTLYLVFSMNSLA